MPNWCKNRLNITGAKHDLARFAATTICSSANEDDEVFDFNAVIPIPAGLVDLRPLTHDEEVATSFLKLLSKFPPTQTANSESISRLKKRR